MKLAITPWNQRVAPVFDSAERILILDLNSPTNIDSGTYEDAIIESQEFDFGTKNPAEKARFLVKQGVEHVICGAISRDLELLIRDQGIAMHSFITGTLDVVLNAWITGQLNNPIFTMPGCFAGGRHHWGRKRNGTGHSRGLKGGYYAKR